MVGCIEEKESCKETLRPQGRERRKKLDRKGLSLQCCSEQALRRVLGAPRKIFPEESYVCISQGYASSRTPSMLNYFLETVWL